MNLPTSFVQNAKEICSKAQFLTEPGDCWAYGYDNSRKHHCPDGVFLPQNNEQVVEIVKLCHEHQVNLTTRGRATGTTGGAIPFSGGVVVSLEKMDQILHFDPDNRYIEVQAGVLNLTVQKEVAKHGYFWPPDPTSAPYCSVGGNLACNAAGPKAVKYGTCRENTLGLKVVTGTGAILECGIYTTKGVVGYDLTRLFVGSEGTLGIILEGRLKLLPKPQQKQTLCALYDSNQATSDAIVAIMSQAIVPCALEFIDGTCIEMIRNHANAPLPHDAKGMLLIEVDGSEGSIDADVQAVSIAAKNKGLIELNHAQTQTDIEALWKIRKSLSPALRSLSPHKINEDIVIPPTRMPEFLDFVDNLSAQTKIPIVNFGHAGNGNIHVNLLANPLDPEMGPIAEKALSQLFDKVLELKGTLSGEHGVGVEKREFVNKEIPPASLQIMKDIKGLFDPKGILNPGKMF